MTKTHTYKGYIISKPEGAKYWNVYTEKNYGLSAEFYTKTLKEARVCIDDIIEQESK